MGSKVTILINCGVMLNFLCATLIEEFNLAVDPSILFEIFMLNRSCTEGQGMCVGIKLNL